MIKHNALPLYMYKQRLYYIFMIMGEDYDDDDDDDDDDRFLRVCVLKPDKSLFLIIISECSSTSCCFAGCGSTAGCNRDQIR